MNKPCVPPTLQIPSFTLNGITGMIGNFHECIKGNTFRMITE